jgi:hypothetical protein
VASSNNEPKPTKEKKIKKWMGGLLKLSNQSNAFAYKERWFGVEQ